MERLTRRQDGYIDIGDEGTVTACIQRLADYEDAEEQKQLIKLPFKLYDNVYVICKCEDISMYHDNDYEHGTGSIECPFERQCKFGDCDDSQVQVLEAAVECVFLNEDGLQFGLSDIHYGHPNFSVDDIGKTVFLTLGEAAAALNSQAEGSAT